MQGVSFLVHGQSKQGKSFLADTCPGPRLILDAEGGASTRFTPSRKILWDPRNAPPESDGTWDTCVIHVRNFGDVQLAYQWLETGRHSFKSVIIDSLSETQQRCIDAIVGVEQMKTQDWGELLRKMSALVRSYRDLIIHPMNPLSTVMFICMTRDIDGKKHPYVQGQLAATVPYYVDVVGYLWMEVDDQGEVQRRMLVSPHSAFEAGDRTGRLGKVVENPNVLTMLETIYATTN